MLSNVCSGRIAVIRADCSPKTPINILISFSRDVFKKGEVHVVNLPVCCVSP